MEIELSSGVTTLINRMKTNPEEFFGDAKRWSFIFREHFRDVMTEAEKGAIHQGMKEVRRIEFDVLVVKELLREEQEQTMAEQAQKASHQGGPFGIAGSNVNTAFGNAVAKPSGGLIRGGI